MSIYIDEGSGRALCRYCGETIGKGVSEVIGNLGSGNYEYHYHTDCFVKRNKKFIQELSRMAGMLVFDETDVKEVLEDLLEIELEDTDKRIDEAFEYVKDKTYIDDEFILTLTIKDYLEGN